MASPSDQSMVVGGGLAGMSAANAVLGNGGSVLLDTFTSDALKGEAKKPELAKVLCENSGADRFNLDLSVVAGLGGRSAPRIHRCKERFPGMTLTYALIQMVEKIAAKYLTGGPLRSFPLDTWSSNSSTRQSECLDKSSTYCSRPILKLLMCKILSFASDNSTWSVSSE